MRWARLLANRYRNRITGTKDRARCPWRNDQTPCDKFFVDRSDKAVPTFAVWQHRSAPAITTNYLAGENTFSRKREIIHIGQFWSLEGTANKDATSDD